MSVHLKGKIWHYEFMLNGRRYAKTTYETQKGRAQAVEALVRAKALKDRTPPELRKTPKLSEYAKEFLADQDARAAAGHLAENTRKDYHYGISLLEGSAIWQQKIDAIDSAKVGKLAFKSWATGNCAIRTLRHLLHDARRAKLIYTVDTFKLFEENERTTVIEPWLEELMLAEAREPLRTAMVIILDSFMRPDEVAAIKWENVLWDRAQIFIPKGKTKKSRRHVGLTSRMRDALASQKKTAEWVFPSKSAECGHILPNSLGKAYREMKKRLLKKIRETNPAWQWPADLVLYSCRHTGATNYSDAVGANQMKVANALGHADLRTTRRYVHHANDAGEVMDKVVQMRRRA